MALIPDNVADRISAVQDVLDSALTAGKGIGGSLDFAADLPGSVSGSLAVAGALGSSTRS